MNTSDATIVIPNWNGLDVLKKHLPFVVQRCGDAPIILVDDCSTDDSILYVCKNFPEIMIVKKDRHEGFASTVNAGAKEAKTDFVVLLNTDIEPEKDFLKPLLSRFSDPSVFAVGCMDKSMENGKEELRGRGIGWWGKGFYYHKRGDVNAHDTAWVSGGSGAFRRSMWNVLGGMDPIYNPFYWEDIDLSYRARKLGWKLYFESKSIVRHYHEKGTILHTYSIDTIKMISYRNQYIFIWKNCSDFNIILLHFLFLPIRIIQSLFHGDSRMLKGFLMAIVHLPRILQYRFTQRLDYKISDRNLSMQ
jgi:GT2 family glycosyltransferase